MANSEFKFGPFIFEPAARGLKVNGIPSRIWVLNYGDQELAQKPLPDEQRQADTIMAFSDSIEGFIRATREEHAPDRVDLIDQETDEIVGSFLTHDMCGMTPGLINDRSRYWIRSADKHYSRDVTLSEFAAIASQHVAPANSWIAGLLPDDVLTTEVSEWRAPTSWEVRHVVGEGSFTGISGAKAAQLVGVTPQNFRKYTASDDAKTRQPISFAMWHYLLGRLGIIKITERTQ